MKFGKRFCQALGLVALGALVSTAAIGQVTSRFTAPNSALTTVKVIPGSTFGMDVRVDAPATQTIGAAFRVLQTVPAAPSSFFQITARDFTASIYNDAASGTPDATVLALPSALLNPDNDDNLGRNTIGLAGAAAGSNLYVEKITFSVDPATPLNTYTIAPTPGGTSAVTDTAFTDYDMSTTAALTVIVGQTLTVTENGAGTGVVTSDLGVINCPGVCSDIYPGSTVTLTAVPNGGSVFTGWSGGGCAGVGTCVVTVNAATAVTATFGLAPVTLTVTPAGGGTGVVTSVPAGINCPGTCAAPYAVGTVVTLTAVANGGSAFGGWSGGGCAGVGTCVVTMNAATTVTATFNLPPVPLTVTKAGTGTGTVTSVPAGINCGATCVFNFPQTTVVTLTAAPTGASGFTGWSGGGCAGVGTCVVTMNAATSVTATFDLVPQTLTVTLAGTGTGTVTSAPAGINCPGTCSFAFPANQVVTLTAVNNAGSVFTGWSGCAGLGTCVVTMSGAQAETATFQLPPTTTLTGEPTNPSNNPNPQFTFTSSLAGSTFLCQLDGGAIFLCASGVTVSVGNGVHTFKVAADGPGNNLDPIGASYTWTVAGVLAVVGAIPTLSEWALLLLALLVGSAGVLMARRRKA